MGGTVGQQTSGTVPRRTPTPTGPVVSSVNDNGSGDVVATLSAVEKDQPANEAGFSRAEFLGPDTGMDVPRDARGRFAPKSDS